MKFITRKAHSVLDYLVGLILMASHLLEGPGKRHPEILVASLLGLFTIAISILTDYEGGLIKLIPFRIHLASDVLQALILAFSCLIFESSAKITVALIGIAMLEIAVVLCTNAGKPEPDQSSTVKRLNRLRQRFSKQ